MIGGGGVGITAEESQRLGLRDPRHTGARSCSWFESRAGAGRRAGARPGRARRGSPPQPRPEAIPSRPLPRLLFSAERSYADVPHNSSYVAFPIMRTSRSAARVFPALRRVGVLAGRHNRTVLQEAQERVAGGGTHGDCSRWDRRTAPSGLDTVGNQPLLPIVASDRIAEPQAGSLCRVRLCRPAHALKQLSAGKTRIPKPRVHIIGNSA